MPPSLSDSSSCLENLHLQFSLVDRHCRRCQDPSGCFHVWSHCATFVIHLKIRTLENNSVVGPLDDFLCCKFLRLTLELLVSVNQKIETVNWHKSRKPPFLARGRINFGLLIFFNSVHKSTGFPFDFCMQGPSNQSVQKERATLL